MSESHDIPVEKEARAGEEPSNAEPASAPTPPQAKRRIPKRTLFFGTCAVLAILIYSIANIDSLIGVFRNLGSIFAPLIIGGVIAYLCNPFLKFYEKTVFRKMGKGNLRRGLSLLLTVITVVALLAAIVALILPELVNSLNTLVTNYDTYLNGLLAFVQNIINRIPVIDIDVSDTDALIAFIEKTFGSMEAATNKLLKALQELILKKDSLNAITGTLMGVVTALKNLILGIFIAFYILASKEKRVAQIRKCRAAFLTEKQDSKLTDFVKHVDQTFGGYIKSLLLDAVAVGVVTFLMLTIFNVSEYNLLIAAICAVTNIIPVFGPFIGAIPSALIVLITSPGKLLTFVILVVVIQQIDGNILVPRIQGNNTGISSLAVLIAITVMGSLFGLMGMIIGVPVFAVIIEMIKRAIEAQLIQKKAPTDTVSYWPDDAVGDAEEEVYYEHSHLRYKYEHSKLKIYVDRARMKFKRDYDRKTEEHKKAKKSKENSQSNGKGEGNKKK